ncbi:hypothetical protein [Fimbriiglobus ruber]|uniref:hypothetical protein n=1 Tax=Fimbriiglobus ruber TaxID=1908690 RepID=UPI000B4C0AEB|nr:hypothetical protein [Fimbriiglobus ruber]
MTDFTNGASPKTHPILMSSAMIRALLEGRKSQTRRIVKPQPDKVLDGEPYWNIGGFRLRPMLNSNPLLCPYGQPGDLLWVRETWGAVSPDEYPRPIRECEIQYRADLPPGCTDQPGEWPADEAKGDEEAPKWRPSIHMPRWASRLTLELTEVRVERLQDISEEDAKAEGIFFTDYGRKCFHRASPPQDVGDCPAPAEHHPQRDGWMWDRTRSSDQCLGSARSAYGNLWHAINGRGSWSKNPWCWCLSFRVHQKNVDEILGRNAA